MQCQCQQNIIGGFFTRRELRKSIWSICIRPQYVYTIESIGSPARKVPLVPDCLGPLGQAVHGRHVADADLRPLGDLLPGPQHHRQVVRGNCRR